MYIGAEEPDRSPSHRLLDGLVDAIANDTPPLHEIRIRLWNGSAITVSWDGVPSNRSPRAVEASRFRPSISSSCIWPLEGGRKGVAQRDLD
jgi:hypothetical protein